jgi:hypothetical protein
MNEDNRGVALVLVGVLALVVLGMWDQGRKDQVEARATETPAVIATAVERESAEVGERATMKVAPTKTLPAGVEVTGEEVVTYTYRLDEWGERVWSEAGRIEAGRLIKAQGCAAVSPTGARSAYRQVEYQPDLERPGFWLVEWVPCTPD